MIVVERPGIGLSSKDPNISLLGTADDFVEFVDALHIQRFGLIGYSAGGPVSLVEIPPSVLNFLGLSLQNA